MASRSRSSENAFSTHHPSLLSSGGVYNLGKVLRGSMLLRTLAIRWKVVSAAKNDYKAHATSRQTHFCSRSLSPPLPPVCPRIHLSGGEPHARRDFLGDRRFAFSICSYILKCCLRKRRKMQGILKQESRCGWNLGVVLPSGRNPLRIGVRALWVSDPTAHPIATPCDARYVHQLPHNVADLGIGNNLNFLHRFIK